MSNTFPQGKPVNYNKALPQYPAPATKELGAMPDWNTDPGQFKSQKPLVAMPSMADNPNEVMSFKNASSNPMDAPLPLGRSYSEFPASRANESKPRDRFQDKVDVRSISKGNIKTIQDTGTPHS